MRKVVVSLETLRFSRPFFDVLLLLTVKSLRYTSHFFAILQVLHSALYICMLFFLLFI